MSMKSKWQSLMTFLNISTVDSSADGIFLKEESVDKMAALHTENEKLKTDLDTAQKAGDAATKQQNDLQAANDKLTADLATANASIKTLQDQVATLSAKPSATPTKVEKKADEIQSNNQPEGERLVTANEERREKLKQINSFSFKDSHI
jgi:chromosome segregation ATPase